MSELDSVEARPEGERRYVLLDANVIIGHAFNLAAPDFQALRKAADAGFVRVVIPEVVLREVARKFEERVRAAESSLVNAIEEIGTFTGMTIEASLDVAAAVRAYEEKLAKWLQELGALTPSIESVSTRELFERAMRRKKPFHGESDKGMKDALVWECVVKLGSDVQYVAVVTSNTKDFVGATTRELHEDLASEVRQRGTPMSVEWFPDLKALRESWLNKELDIWQEEEFIAGAGEAFLALDIPMRYKAEIADGVRRELEWSLPPEFQSPEITDMTLLGTPEITSSSWESRGVVEVEAAFSCALSVSGYATKGDGWHIEEQPGFTVDDWDWNEHMVAASYEDEVTIFVSVLMKMEPRELTGFQISSVGLRRVMDTLGEH